MRSVEQLKRIFGQKAEGMIFVDNSENFKAAIDAKGNGEYFMDMFAGDFGHCTPQGNMLLAERAAVAVEKYISGHCVDSMKSIICIIRANFVLHTS